MDGIVIHKTDHSIDCQKGEIPPTATCRGPHLGSPSVFELVEVCNYFRDLNLMRISPLTFSLPPTALCAVGPPGTVPWGTSSNRITIGC